jgi:hypothetical protein
VPDPPSLHPGHLQNEHVVRVVVDVEALRHRRGEIDVHLDRMRELGLEVPTEVRQRCPIAMESLQDDGRPIPEQLVHAPGVDQVIEIARLDPGALRVARRREGRSFLDHPESGEAEPPLRQQAIDVGKREKLVERFRAGPVERRPTPVLC